MVFQSILFQGTEAGIKKEAPVFFVDLNLDQVIETITAGKKEYDLEPFFYTFLNDIDLIEYRQEVFRDLENESLFSNIQSFATRMLSVRRYHTMSEKLYYKYHQEGWFLEVADIYCDAMSSLLHDLNLTNLESRGFRSFRNYMRTYANSNAFTSLLTETKELKTELSALRYCILIKGNCVKVRKYESEVNYSIEIEDTFAKFKQGAVNDYRAKFPLRTGMNHVQAQIVNFVAKLYPDTFLRLDTFCARYREFLDETVRTFDREIQFYIAYLEHISKLKHAGLPFCYPQISATDKEVYNYEGFDLALAHKLVTAGTTVVCNDFYLKGKERIIVVSGPNQGGKTTFARIFGQLHYLAGLGCPVPGREARLFLSDKILTHFEKVEDIESLRGKLQDDLIRIRGILDQATPNSVILINEIFTSTTLQDAVFLSKEILHKIIELDLLCVCVTFIDELASLSEKTVSMVSTVVPENPALRTFKILRRHADGLAYAISIAEKYRLTYNCIKERLGV